MTRGLRIVCHVAIATLVALVAACSDNPTQPRPPSGSLTVTPPVDTVATGDTVRFSAILKDANGNVVTGHPMTWASNNLSVATVSGSGLVTGVDVGRATIRATSEGKSDSSVVTVLPRVASVIVTPDTASVIIGFTLQLSATPKDAGGNVLSGLAVAWGSDHPALATVSPTGLMTVVATSSDSTYVEPTITAAIGGTSGTARIMLLPNVASVTVIPNAALLVAGSTVQLTALPRDSHGNVLTGRPVTWATDNPTAATVSSAGLVAAVSQGSATIRATSEGRTGTAQINLVRVASVTVAPETVTVVHDGSAQLTATLKDSAGNVLSSGSVAWSSGSGVATVAAITDRNASATGVSTGTATITATSGAASGSATIVVLPPISFADVSGGLAHTCALTAAGDAYCWGLNDDGRLGTGSWLGPEASAGHAYSAAPTPVSGGLTFAVTRPGVAHTCALTPAGAAYCWGIGRTGELGIGSTTGLDLCTFSICSATPLAVAGGLTFVTLAAGGGDYDGGGNTCGITTDSLAYCWGHNARGQLGDGSTTSSSVPVAVTGGLHFTAVSIGKGLGGYGNSYACGLAADSTAYCWGENFFGTLGDSTTNNSSAPISVAGGLHFKAISAGYAAVCGLTADSTAYCWGTYISGSYGTTPTLLPGGLTFTALSSGSGRSCGLTPTGDAYCWDYTRTPTLVPGGLAFASISMMGGHACGRTTGGVVYCWGSNYWGQLGDGTTTDSALPVKVVGQP